MAKKIAYTAWSRDAVRDRPFQILLGNFLATFRILSNFFVRATSSNFSENYHFFGNFCAILNLNAE